MFLQVCPVCEHRNPRGSRFCNECGSPLQLRFCPACGAAEDVMSLECQSCGEKLPLVAVADAAAESEVAAPASVENIWKTEAPQPAFFTPSDGDVQVTVHGGAAPAPAVDMVATTSPEPDSEPAEPEPALPADPVATTPKVKGPTIIERFRSAEVELELRPSAVAPTEIAKVEPAPEAIELTAESDSEIEVSAEAETLVEASVAPVALEVPEVVTVADPIQMDAIASQLREGAWSSAMSIDPSPAITLAPALIRPPPPMARRLSLHRVGLLVAAAGVVAALVYSTRLAPDNAPVTVQAAAPPPAASPIPRPPDSVPPAAGLAVAVPSESLAREAPDKVAPPAEHPLEPPVAAKPAPARRASPPPVTQTETFAPAAPAQARRVPVEAPRPCTEAVAALGLCTP
jgi:hypothetical protein